jgi:hypothetical protein
MENLIKLYVYQLMYGNKVMLTQGYYGLVKQNGPWKLTPQDRIRLAQRDPISFGGGNPAGGTAHAGHANWMTTVSYPNRADGMSGLADFSSYPSVIDQGAFPSNRRNALSAQTRDRTRAFVRGIAPLQGPIGTAVRVIQNALGQPATLKAPPVVEGPGALPEQQAPFTREFIPAGRPINALKRMRGDEEIDAIEPGGPFENVRGQPSLKKIKKATGRLMRRPQGMETVDERPAGPVDEPMPSIPGSWPSFGVPAPVYEPIIQPRNVPIMDPAPGEGDLELNSEAQNQNRPDVVEDPFDDRNAITETAGSPVENPFSDKFAITEEPSQSTLPTRPDTAPPTLAEGQTMSEYRAERKRQQKLAKEQKRVTKAGGVSKKSAVKSSVGEALEVLGEPSVTNSATMIDAIYSNLRQAASSIATAVGIGQAVENSDSPAAVIQQVQAVNPGTAAAGALGDAPVPQDMDQDLGAPEAMLDGYVPSAPYIGPFSKEREKKKAERKKKAKEEAGGFKITETGKKQKLNKQPSSSKPPAIKTKTSPTSSAASSPEMKRKEKPAGSPIANRTRSKRPVVTPPEAVPQPPKKKGKGKGKGKAKE